MGDLFSGAFGGNGSGYDFGGQAATGALTSNYRSSGSGAGGGGSSVIYIVAAIVLVAIVFLLGRK